MPTPKSTGTVLTLIMTILVVGGFAIILMLNFAVMLGIVPSRYISPNDVRGMAVEHNKILYTLNFDQQNTIVDIFNRAIPVAKGMIADRKATPKDIPQISKIIIYRFNGAADIEIIPTAYVSKSSSVLNNASQEHISMVFSVHEWNPNGFLEEATSDELLKVLSTTYDQ